MSPEGQSLSDPFSQGTGLVSQGLRIQQTGWYENWDTVIPQKKKEIHEKVKKYVDLTMSSTHKPDL